MHKRVPLAEHLSLSIFIDSAYILGSQHSTTKDVASQLQFVSMQLEGEYAIELSSARLPRSGGNGTFDESACH